MEEAKVQQSDAAIQESDAVAQEQDVADRQPDGEAGTDGVREAITRLQDYMCSRILGQQRLVNRLLIALLSDGHMLVEGPPGLAKTRSIQTLADGIEADFHRVQFTPDLLPADLTGTDIYRPQSGDFVFRKGPLFHNLVLADEINRAPAKVQSALLEAMAERQITVGGSTYKLPDLFLGNGNPKPYRAGGNLSLAGGATGQVPDARAGGLPRPGTGTDHIAVGT